MADFGGNTNGKLEQILWGLKRAKEQAEWLAGHKDLVCWLGKPDSGPDETLLCGIPRDLDRRLYRDLWSVGIPVILTSGTLSASGDFSRIKGTLGLDHVNKVLETCKPSPFDYYKNILIYISKDMPFPETKDVEYIDAVACESLRGFRSVLYLDCW